MRQVGVASELYSSCVRLVAARDNLFDGLVNGNGFVGNLQILILGQYNTWFWPFYSNINLALLTS